MKKLYYRCALINAIFLYACLPNTFSQNWNQIMKLSAADRTTWSVAGRGSALFGTALASDGDYLAISSPKDILDYQGKNILSDAGSVFIYQLTGGEWKFLKKLSAPDRKSIDGFGTTIALRGNTLVVGVPNAWLDASGLNQLLNAGAVYVYSKDVGGTNNWGLVKKLVATNRVASDFFGCSVSLGDSTLIVGSIGDDEDVSNNNFLEGAGSVYIFKQSSGNPEDWVLLKKLVPADRRQSAFFGNTVSLSNNVLAVGAYGDGLDANGMNHINTTGSVYLFERDLGGSNAWGQKKKIVAPDRTAGDMFGSSLTLLNGLLVVGAPDESHDATGSGTKSRAGSAYVFEQDFGGANAWGFRKKLVAADRAAGDGLAYSSAIMGDYIALGARTESEDADGANTFPEAGSAYVFGKNTGGANNWGQLKKLVAPDRDSDHHFASSFCTNGTNLFIGVPFATTDAQGLNFAKGRGAVYQLDQNEGGMANFGFVQKLMPINPVSNQRFGNALAMDGDYAVVGHLGDFSDAMGQNHLMEAGSAWILKNMDGQWTPVKKLVPPVRAQDDYFGYSVAISGPTVVVGAYGEDEDAAEANSLLTAGAAYLFAKDEGGADNWGFVKKLVAADRAANDQFGRYVAINGSIIAIGAPMDIDDVAAEYTTYAEAGSVYIFSCNEGGNNNWGQVKKVIPVDRKIRDGFGRSLSLSGTILVASSPSKDDGSRLDAGAAYVFEKDEGGDNAWGQVKKLLAPDRDWIHYFGWSVAISGNMIVVGSPGDELDAEGENRISGAGSANLFGRDQGGTNTWGFVKKLVAPDRQGDAFGYTVAIYDTTVVIGAPSSEYDTTGSTYMWKAGSAYIFTENQNGAGKWGMAQKLTAADRGVNDNFSYYSTISLSGQTLLIGAYYEDEDMYGLNGIHNAGSVYFFKNGCNTYSLPVANNMVVGKQGQQATNYYNNNCALLATVTPSGTQPIGGAVTARVWIESIQPENYVRRHFEVAPYINRQSATGRVTLYFTQEDFTSFNTVNTPMLPAGPTDNTGKANLLIERNVGFSSDGSGRPPSYSGAVEIINPADNDIVWNYTHNRWEASFDVAGFGAFFVKTTNIILPIQWLYVQARLNTQNCAEISWQVEEKDALTYHVERSTTGAAFDAIGTVSSRGNGTHHYGFTDPTELKGYALYRIRQTDKQGRYTYSAIVRLNTHQRPTVSVYPNPTTNRVTITMPGGLINSRMRVCNIMGMQVMTANLTSQNMQVELGRLPKGIYMMQFANGEVLRVVKK